MRLRAGECIDEALNSKGNGSLLRSIKVPSLSPCRRCSVCFGLSAPTRGALLLSSSAFIYKTCKTSAVEISAKLMFASCVIGDTALVGSIAPETRPSSPSWRLLRGLNHVRLQMIGSSVAHYPVRKHVQELARVAELLVLCRGVCDSNALK